MIFITPYLQLISSSKLTITKSFVKNSTLYTLGIGIILCFSCSKVFAQLDNADWDANNSACITDALLYPGVAVATCGVLEDQVASERYVIAYIGMNEGPGTSRSEITDTDSTLHHTDWLVSSIGNVFGTAINESTAEVFVTASSNYGSVIGIRSNTSPSILNYGSIDNPSSDTEAAGRIYRLDPVTGAVTVFATLPQQTTTVEHWDCERESQDLDRTDTGVGLGNIVYDEINDQFFVSNVEDGRIYRLSSSGTIIDSYDPGTLDNDAAGITDLEDIPYGLAIEPGSNRLFYGLVDAGTDANSNTAIAGAPAIYSIDLNADGGWASTTTNNTSPTSYSWDNYVGTEQFHTTVPTGSGDTFTEWTTYFISDLAFDTEGNLLVGVRVGCYGSWHSSYNHWGETDLITLNTANNLYDSTPLEYDISVTGDAGADDSYGGVAVYDKRNTNCDVWYVASSADVLEEQGPHGIAIWDSETTSAPVSTLGVFSYGVLTNGDPKGIGGDVEIYNGCKATCDLTGPTTVCPGALLTYSFSPTCPDSSIVWTVSGDAAIQGADDQTAVSILAGSSNFTVSLTVNSVEQPCIASVTVDPVPILSALTDEAICSNSAFTTANLTTSVTNSVPVTYQWYDNNGTNNPGTNAISGQTTATLTALPTAVGSYSYRVEAINTNNNSCSASTTVNLVIHALPIVSVADVLKCTSNSEIISAVASGGTGSYTYSWTGPSSDPGDVASFSTNSAGIYQVTISDGNNCTATSSGELIEQAKTCLPVTLTIKRGTRN